MSQRRQNDASEGRRVLFVNCSAPHYNLGVAKAVDWLRSEGHEVETAQGDPGMFAVGYDLVCLSVIFSWHAPIARKIALQVKDDAEVWCGGPGMRALEKWWQAETGLTCTRGLDQRFERQRGNYKMAFASRGCDQGCWFCIVPLLEGSTYTLDYDFVPAPVLCDNNLAGLPSEFQRYIVKRYQESGVKLLDANSGFAPKQFTAETYETWRPIVHTWRFALDEMKELHEAREMLRLLSDIPASRKRVYVLIGNEPLAACYERAEEVIAEGGEPFCQPWLTLNMLDDPRDPRTRLPEHHGWTTQQLRDFARYYNRWIWRSVPLWEYKPRLNEPPLFAFLQPLPFTAYDEPERAPSKASAPVRLFE